MQVFTKIISLFFVSSISLSLFGQIKSGVILYERKTNLLKKYKTAESQRWLRGEKTKIDRFNLHFNPEKSIFLPDESTIPSKADWATSKNTVYQNFKLLGSCVMTTITGDIREQHKKIFGGIFEDTMYHWADNQAGRNAEYVEKISPKLTKTPSNLFSGDQ